jgi:alpha-1,2-mannosyltransferase
MTSRVSEVSVGPEGPSTVDPSRRRPIAFEPLTLWIVGSALTAVAAIYSVWYSAHEPEMDFQVYRMGGQHLSGSGLYSAHIEVLGRHLLFTYPPVAAFLFWPISYIPTFAGQVLWDAVNLVALLTLLAVSIAAARRGRVEFSDCRTALLLLAPVALLLYPVRSDLALGQINILLVLAIVADLTMDLSWGGRSLPRGALVGLAAAVKLTPLVFIPYLAASRQWRAARNATVTFAVATGVMFALSPRASWQYFSKDAFDVQRVGNSLTIGNQTLHAAVMRAHLSLTPMLFDLLAVVVLCGGTAIAAVAYRQSSSLLALLVCAATGLLLSPISWMHHYVWIVPALIWLAAGKDRPAKGVCWALLGALVFMVVPPDSAAGSGPLWFVRDNAYVLATLVFVVSIGVMLWTRHRAVSHRSEPPTSAPSPMRSAGRCEQGTGVRPASHGYRATMGSRSG